MKKPRCLFVIIATYFLLFSSPTLPEASGLFLFILENILSSAPGGVRLANSQALGHPSP